MPGEQLEQGIALYEPQHQALTPLYGGYNPKVMSLAFTAWALWSLGYPDQARVRSARGAAPGPGAVHPFSLVIALVLAAWFHQERRGRARRPRAGGGSDGAVQRARVSLLRGMGNYPSGRSAD